jgi:hypothetical protein
MLSHKHTHVYVHVFIFKHKKNPKELSILKKQQDELWANAHLIPLLFGKQEVGIWRVKKRFPRYGVPIWILWPNIRFLPSIVAEKNATKNEHICSMCRKINKVGKQEIGIWWVQKRFPQYGVPIWSLWPNIRSLPSIVAEKNVMKNVHICSMCIKTN